MRGAFGVGHYALRDWLRENPHYYERGRKVWRIFYTIRILTRLPTGAALLFAAISLIGIGEKSLNNNTALIAIPIAAALFSFLVAKYIVGLYCYRLGRELKALMIWNSDYAVILETFKKLDTDTRIRVEKYLP